jgi:glycosyltransferase involved in cell wall biosynthesis
LSTTTAPTLSFDELVVHAIAQLPGTSTIQSLHVQPARPAILTAQAYGIAERVSWRTPTETPSHHQAMTLAALLDDLRVMDELGSSTTDPSSQLMGERVMVLSKAATHYRTPLFNAISKRLNAVGAAFKAVFISADRDERWWMESSAMEFEHGFLTPAPWLRTNGGALLSRGFDEVKRYAPTLVLSGGFSPALSGRAANYAAKKGIPFGIWSGEIPSRPTAGGRLRSVQRRRLVTHASFGVAYGSRSAGYLRALSPDLPIVLGRNTTVLPDRGSTFGEGRRLRLLAVSRAVKGKGLDVLIDAMGLLADDVELELIGDGPELSRLREKGKYDARIHFSGALASDSVRIAYNNADVFLFPSQFDVFGLVLVEAMAAGLTCIVSREPGAVDDLCVAERNAVIVDQHEPAAWADAIGRVIANPARSEALGAAAATTIRSRWTLEHAADAMIAGFRLGQLTRASSRVIA